MQKLRKHLQFLVKATNQHGVHSPFVYSYVTKCLYNKLKYKGSKSINVLFKSISYFEAKRIMLPDGENELKEAILKKFPEIEFVTEEADIIFLPKEGADQAEKLLSNKKNLHNNTMVLIDYIYLSKKNEAIWKTLKQNHKVTVTVDMFYCGAIFVRREQVKEHFKIRI
ncbi:hypothetical protein [Zobellia alginiliquefaciens]|uniref:hypothetical protein n=1 Tax=Zobellia alginiliquefaciens TaxID=3032586 RepID=UPI0023E35DFD|nr:hypothetical protein [Zobellia alginiliquefaciens]